MLLGPFLQLTLVAITNFFLIPCIILLKASLDLLVYVMSSSSFKMEHLTTFKIHKARKIATCISRLFGKNNNNLTV